MAPSPLVSNLERKAEEQDKTQKGNVKNLTTWADQQSDSNSEYRDSYLSKGFFQLFYSNHVCSFGEEFWAHQLYKILKINMTSHLEKRDFGTYKITIDF